MVQEGRRKKPGMTRWFDFSVMAATRTRNTFSTLLGSMIDTRRFNNIEGSDSDLVFSYEDFRGEDFWFDYMADTGDGWNATYTMAYLLSCDSITPRGAQSLPRGTFAMLGGDEVYPFASKSQYEERFVWPFNQAAGNLKKFRVDAEIRDLYCIPGNHDWYDSLVSFTRRFCNKRAVGAFRTHQRRSYFVLKLPFQWQLWAVDLQLHHDIDVDQLAFFRRHSQTLRGNEQIILCLAEPDWVYGEQASADLHINVALIEQLAEAQGAQVRLHLAGDLHHYQLHQNQPGSGSARSYSQTKIVSGGGGAFMHPTHTYGPTTKEGLHRKSSYPTARQSRRLSLRLLLFAGLNWQLSLAFGALYLAMFWNVSSEPAWSRIPLDHPGVFLLFLLTLLGMTGFVEVRERWSTIGRVLAKVGCGVGHFAGHMVVAWQTWRLSSWLIGNMGFADGDLLKDYLVRGAVFPLGGLLGGTLLGLYLLFMTNVLRVHENDSFAALRISGYKNFLRCRLTPKGLTVHAIGVPAVVPEEGQHPVETFSLDEIRIAR